jgi:hypothetical protein
VSGAESARAKPHFAVDRRGLAALAMRRDDWRFAVLCELFQNAVDNTEVWRVEVDVAAVPGRAQIEIRVADDHPAGFANLSHAWTLFAPSEKRGDPTRRGRFNLGEKVVAAVCDWMTIETTKGSVRFDDEGRHVGRKRRDAGSEVRVALRGTRLDLEDMLAAARRLIPPANLEVMFNGEPMLRRQPLGHVACALLTDIEGADGTMRRQRRHTTVAVYERAGDVAWLYEMGIPVMEMPDDRFDLDVAQKVPLSLERDGVPPSFTRSLRVAVANDMASLITADDAHRPWVREALADPRASEALVRRAVEARFGERVVAYDPSDRESNLTVVARGYVVIHGSQLSAEEWENVRRVGVAPPAGKVAPSPKVYGDGPPTPQVPLDEWTPGMRILAAYARRLALEFHADGAPIEVAMELADGAGWAANYGGKRLAFNVSALGQAWFARAEAEVGEEHDDLLLHELGHEKGGHLTTTYHDALTRYGARLRRVGAALEASARSEVLRQAARG